MNNITKYVGFDVSKDKIAVAIAEEGREGARFYGSIRNEPNIIKKTLQKLGEKAELHVCYEAGPCGFTIYRQLQTLGIDCQVIAPSLIPTKAGDKVKTDRRDAIKLGQLLRSGELTEIWTPSDEDEALRDLVRAREDCVQNLTRAKHRLVMFLHKYGIKKPAKDMKCWSTRYWKWLRGISFENQLRQMSFDEYVTTIEETISRKKRLEDEIHRQAEGSEYSPLIKALQTLRGVGEISAITIVAEVGHFLRFDKPTQLMAYGGVVPSEYSSGDKVSRGGITKMGNNHLRRILVECAWSYRFKAAMTRDISKRQEGQPLNIQKKAWEAQLRLCGKYRRMVMKGKGDTKAVIAVARELLGFIWSIACEVEREQLIRKQAA